MCSAILVIFIPLLKEPSGDNPDRKAGTVRHLGEVWAVGSPCRLGVPCLLSGTAKTELMFIHQPEIKGFAFLQ